MGPDHDTTRCFERSALSHPSDNLTWDKLRIQYLQQIQCSGARTYCASDTPIPDSSPQTQHRYHLVPGPQGSSHYHYSSEELFQRGFTYTHTGVPSEQSDYGAASFERIPQYDEIPDLSMDYIQMHDQRNSTVDTCNGLRSTTLTDVIPTSPVATSLPNDCAVSSAAETNMLPPLYPFPSPLLPALSSDVLGDGKPILSPPKVPSALHSPTQYADAYISIAPACQWRYHISALEPVTVQEEAGSLVAPSLRSCLEPYRTMPYISAYGAMSPERRSEAPCSYAVEDFQGHRVSASLSQTSNKNASVASATASRTQNGLSSAAHVWPCEMCGIVIARRQDLIRHQESVHERIHASQCLACSRVLSRGDALKRHIRKHPSCSRFYVKNGLPRFMLSNSPRRSSGKRQTSSGTFDSHCGNLGLN